MKRILITTIAIILHLSGFSQNNSIIPPSPDAQGLAEYANIPVSFFTGTPEINVPIYSIKTNDFAFQQKLIITPAIGPHGIVSIINCE